MRADLPEPSPEERAHSARVADLIRAEIRAAGGAIDFARYMELALYAPGLGYYSAGATKFGAAGDFVTAPELGFVFARCLTRAVAPTLRETRGDILELGPGSGALAAELLLELERLGSLPERYRLLERSADLRERQHATIAHRCPHLLSRCEWLDTPPRDDWSGALIANEVIDALPVRLFRLRDAQVIERRVGIGERDEFIWVESADVAFAALVGDALGSRLLELPDHHSSEICPMLAPWFEQVTQTLRRGSAIFIDYGFSRDALYGAERREGTLRCHFRHRAHDDPLILPGIQDITAWVDFDALDQAGAVAGFSMAGYSSQSEFLNAHGIEEVFARAYREAADERRRYRIAQEVKTLMLGGEMGETFRVMSFRRG